MSVAGILAGTLLSSAGSQYAQQSPLSTIGSTNAPSAFAAIQQKLSASSSVAQPGSTPVSSELSQLGLDLKSGNLAAAQADYAALKLAIAQRHTRPNAQSGNTANENNSPTGASVIADPLAAAMQAYSSLQQGASAGALSSSLITPGSTFSVDA